MEPLDSGEFSVVENISSYRLSKSTRNYGTQGQNLKKLNIATRVRSNMADKIVPGLFDTYGGGIPLKFDPLPTKQFIINERGRFCR